MARKKTRNAIELIRRDVGRDGQFRQMVEDEKLNAKVAHLIRAARTRAKLSQRQLAGLVGTTQPVIARLEDADYEGHSLSMLRRIAEALHRQVDVRFLPPRRAVS